MILHATEIVVWMSQCHKAEVTTAHGSSYGVGLMMMKKMTTLPRLFALLLLAFALSSCGNKPGGSGLVADAFAPPVAEAGAPTTDLSQCGAGCQLAPQTAWTFEGIYRDATCTDPLAQIVSPACAAVPAIGPVSLTYADEVGGRKAGEAAQVTLTEQIAPDAPRYRKASGAAGKPAPCVRANEAAVDITPVNCAGQKACRDATGLLTCAATSCRTFANGCPDYEETRMYAAVNDPVAKGAKPGGAGGGGNSLERLRACCKALQQEAARQGNAPEITAAAANCNTLVAAAGPSGTAPELGALRAAMAGRNIPAICAGF
jgi:hypothetical protein